MESLLEHEVKRADYIFNLVFGKKDKQCMIDNMIEEKQLTLERIDRELTRMGRGVRGWRKNEINRIKPYIMRRYENYWDDLDKTLYQQTFDRSDEEDNELVEIKEEQSCELDELRERIRNMEREILNLKKKLLETKLPHRVRRSTLI